MHRFVCVLLIVCACGVESWRPGKPISLMRNDGNAYLPLQDGYSYKTMLFDQQIDHFGFALNGTFKQRFLIADQFWNYNEGPIFFYTGNEGDIEWFCNNTGFMWDIASDFKALLVFAEHRYYGKSLPFGAETYKKVSNLNYLTSEQALADFAKLIQYIKSTVPGASDSPVVAFGGSYGGMLAAWFRMKYPNVVTGSLAASAPIWQFTDLTPCNAFSETTSRTWLKTSKTCVANVHKSYTVLQETAAKAGGLELLTKLFGLCTPLTNKYDLFDFMNFLADVYVRFAEVNYPYPANFLADLPAWPIKVACSYLSEPLDGSQLLEGLSKVTNLFFNHTGQTKCVDWKGSGSTPYLGYAGWDYQACTEMVIPLCSNNTNMFFNIDWNFDDFSDECYSKYGVRPRENWITLEYWAKQLKLASNIIFSNGMLDPWSSGGVLQSVSDTIVAIQIPDGAHHLDLRAKNPLDTRAVISAREQETNIIRNWLGLTPV